MNKPDILWPLLEDTDRRQYFTDLLSANDCEVTFTKVDGTIRVMNCTLRSEALPDRESTSLTETREKNPDVITVFDLDKQSWRSFKVANVTNIAVQTTQEIP
jgi:WYL_2, Sm-like SH3 beta-barrel fold